jgi:serine/threonine protein kinase
MVPVDDDLDDGALQRLAVYQEQLADGQAAQGLPDGSLAAIQDCLERLEKDRRRLGTGQPTATDVTADRKVGRFRLLRQLGQGSYGIVFLAHDPVLQREVALKVPRLEAFLTPELRQRFLREAQAAARLEHPNIVPVHEAGESDGVCYIASAYCRGTTLAAWLKQQPSLIAPRLAAELVAALADAMQHAHDQGVLHRDLKPGNILVSGGVVSGGDPNDVAAHPSQRTTHHSPLTTRQVKITDFGLAKILEQEEESTRTGAILGTPCYMAPEQAEGRSDDVGPATDVYALGAILYELLTERPPFKGPTTLTTLEQVRSEEPMRPSRLHTQLPRDLETICLKCLRKEPGQRYASAADLAADLRRFIAGEPIRGRPASWGSRFRLWCRRPERITQAGLIMLLLGITMLAWCLSGMVLVTTGVMKVDDPGDLMRFGLRIIGAVYLPMIGSGWAVLRHRHPAALWAGIIVLLSFEAFLVWAQLTGFDVGGLYKDRQLTMFGNIMVTNAIVIVLAAFGVALYAHYYNRRQMGTSLGK